MRIDLFLNAVNLVKRRAVAQDMIAHGAVLVGGAAVKAAKNVKIGDIIELRLLAKDGGARSHKYEVLQIPAAKNTPKEARDQYIREINDR
ncbi:MAG: RNA-binding S4 domain-containing protein [Helicobacteraceae bacterium]|jgi:ribosomal 50S subunit-recycling heat shock protein|nr:RNA-binding S4 domain-containing protein [Helicobacteraceae bacterium]